MLTEVSSRAESIKAEPGKNTDLVIRLYQLLPFEKVREMADKGIVWEGETFKLEHSASQSLAIVRDHMINEAYRKMTSAYGMEFIRLDFGNKMSGVKSDVDHTANVVNGQWEALDAAIKKAGNPKVRTIREAMEKEFQSLWGISQEACDICVHSGKNRIPDWRSQETLAEFDAKMVDVLKGLAGTPDAYFQEGAWRMQVEMRSLAGKLKVFQQLQEIEAELGKNLSPLQRFQAEAKRTRILDENPCTRFFLDENGKVSSSKDHTILDALFKGVNGDILKSFWHQTMAGFVS